MRWTSKYLWLAALGAGLVAWPAWAQESDRGDDDSRSSRSTSRQSDDSSSTDSSEDDSDSKEDRSDRRASGRNQDHEYGNQTQGNRTGRSSTADSSARARSGGQPRTWSQSRTSERSRSNDQGNSDNNTNEQWSNWDDEKDIQARGVWRVANLLGKQVKNHQGEDLGQIEDIVIDLNNHQVRYAALSHGGTLGIGEKLFAVPLSALREQQDEEGTTLFVLNVDDETLERIEGFEDHKSWPAQADTGFLRGGRNSQMARTSTPSQTQNRPQTQNWAQNQNQSQGRPQQLAGQVQASRSFQGEFDEFDDEANQITVTTNDGRRRVYNVARNVRVTHHGRQADLDELEEGDTIRLSYTTGSDNRTIVTAVSDASQQASYNSASYDPNEQNQGDRSQQTGSRSGEQWSRSGQDRASQSRATQTERRSNSGQSGNRANRANSSSEDDSEMDDSSDDSNSSSRSSSRSSTRNRSSEDLDDSDDSSKSSDRSNDSDSDDSNE
jgi:sporulation protein YlmC with PRC-barrel domain